MEVYIAHITPQIKPFLLSEGREAKVLGRRRMRAGLVGWLLYLSILSWFSCDEKQDERETPR